MLTIQFNGKSIEVPQGTSLSGLLEIAHMQSAVVALEVNQQVVSRDQHAQRIVNEGDVVEAVTLVGGG